ncbi:MAG: hypothetical protein CML68_23040 [Rhodobacteraceae bacterium]|nr:hypothetical protein [Paracoccaceae bacterium]
MDPARVDDARPAQMRKGIDHLFGGAGPVAIAPDGLGLGRQIRGRLQPAALVGCGIASEQGHDIRQGRAFVGEIAVCQHVLAQFRSASRRPLSRTTAVSAIWARVDPREV